MFKPALKNNRILRSQQVLNALIMILRRYLPLEMKNTRITAEDIIAILGYASAHRISIDAAWADEMRHNLGRIVVLESYRFCST